MRDNGLVECLPDDYSWFEDQIAGHHPSVRKNGKREIGILKRHGSDRILKLKQDARRGESEVVLYEMMAEALRNSEDLHDESTSRNGETFGQLNGVMKSNGTSSQAVKSSSLFPMAWKEDLRGLARLTPDYHGTEQLEVDGGNHTFLVLSDVSVGYRRPAILDIKMGRLTFDPLASENKKRKESEKYPPQWTMGYRLLGYRMHQEDGSVVFKDKDWGKSHDEKNIVKGLREFFTGGARGHDQKLINDVLQKLQKVSSWFESQTSFHFYASSLLFLYETTPNSEPNVKICMIDFSHVFCSEESHDENYIHGLKSLISHINQI